MTFRPHSSRATLRAAYRWAAVLLLAFTAADMASHGVCGEDWLGLPPASLLASSAEARSVVPILLAAEASTRESSEVPCAEEDCFCCCSHLLVTAQFVLGDVVAAPEADGPAPPGRLTAPPVSLDRPPRLA